MLLENWIIFKYKWNQQRQIIFLIKIIYLMICSKCAHAHETRPRIRMTPTFFHHPIFEEFEGQCERRPKCSATYHSTVFGQHKHNKPSSFSKPNSRCCKQEQTVNCKCCCQDLKTVNIEDDNRASEEKIIRPSSAQKETRLQKQISFNPNSSTKFENAGSHNQLSSHTLLWYNPQKEILLRQCSSCRHHGLPKERKLVELSSCPFYQFETAHRLQDEKPQLAKIYHAKQAHQLDKKLENEQHLACCQGHNQHHKLEQVEEVKTCQGHCLCAKGSCKCQNDCNCGSSCKCCPKFLPYGVCKCNEGCRCGTSCECSCSCCPKNKQVALPKETYKNDFVGQRFCKCATECGCGPECRCGPQCKCSQKVIRNEKQVNGNKATKSTGINNGTRKTKMQQTVRKSEPVFKSVTAHRR